MKFEKGDFLIVKQEMGKPLLVRSLFFDGKKSTGITEKSIVLGKNETLTFSAKNHVIANLGNKPKVGSAFGIKIEPLVKTIPTNGYGDIKCYTELDAPFENRLLKSLFKIKKLLKSKGIHGIKFDTEIRTPKGKYGGYYKSGKNEERMTLMPSQDYTNEDLDYIICHEWAHAFWYQVMGEKKKLRWIKKYHKLVKVREAFEKELQQMLEDIVSIGDLKSYVKDIDEDTKEILKSVYAYIKRVHKISPYYLQKLILNQDDISEMWPSVTHVGKPEVHLTEYATTNPEELFAESFAYYMLGKKIPKDLSELMEKSL